MSIETASETAIQTAIETAIGACSQIEAASQFGAPSKSKTVPLGGRRRGRSPALIPWLLSALLGVCLLVIGGCRASEPASNSELLATTAPAGRLQEVSPPPAVRQLAAALAERSPQLQIEEPTANSLLAGGDWQLRLRLRDWPLVDAGPLGLGPHVAVQIDDQPPLRISDHRPSGQGDQLLVSLPPLAPGSHRITAYAAMPWGEAVKDPGATARLRLQAVAANPLALPAPGSPELIPVSPAELGGSEPLLLDWLLYDAPLQHLRQGDDSWRLRISINGDSFLVDQNAPLWLKGWRQGSNALQLELVDGRGEPLNPPYNSLVRQVNLTGGQPPRWLGARLSSQELAVYLGQLPPETLAPANTAKPDRAGIAADGTAANAAASNDAANSDRNQGRIAQSEIGDVDGAEADGDPADPLEVGGNPAEAPTANPKPSAAKGAEPSDSRADKPIPSSKTISKTRASTKQGKVAKNNQVESIQSPANPIQAEPDDSGASRAKPNAAAGANPAETDTDTDTDTDQTDSIKPMADNADGVETNISDVNEIGLADTDTDADADADADAADTETDDTYAADTYAADTHAADNYLTDTDAADTDTSSVDAKSVDTSNANETNASETSLAGAGRFDSDATNARANNVAAADAAAAKPALADSLIGRLLGRDQTPAQDQMGRDSDQAARDQAPRGPAASGGPLGALRRRLAG